MYVCVCNGVTERQIESAVQDGGAKQLRDLRLLLGVASECGRCASCAHQCLQSALQEQAPVQAAIPVRAAQPVAQPMHWAGEALEALSGVLSPATVASPA
jgi:bacterioferritin-associated ferredoxin